MRCRSVYFANRQSFSHVRTCHPTYDNPDTRSIRRRRRDPQGTDHSKEGAQKTLRAFARASAKATSRNTPILTVRRASSLRYIKG